MQNFCSSNNHLVNEKASHRLKKKLQYTYLAKDSNPEYIKSFYKSIRERQTVLKVEQKTRTDISQNSVFGWPMRI